MEDGQGTNSIRESETAFDAGLKLFQIYWNWNDLKFNKIDALSYRIST